MCWQATCAGRPEVLMQAPCSTLHSCYPHQAILYHCCSLKDEHLPDLWLQRIQEQPAVPFSSHQLFVFKKLMSVNETGVVQTVHQEVGFAMSENFTFPIFQSLERQIHFTSFIYFLPDFIPLSGIHRTSHSVQVSYISLQHKDTEYLDPIIAVAGL